MREAMEVEFLPIRKGRSGRYVAWLPYLGIRG
ncbi:hypothetical protein A0O31_02359 (plasmid) [Thermus brockianus]|jgi:hypothetical protein|uniref:Uncharacterized protein n=1 Tax=Thermus brockianus TaxID=56956 RepID=A0A1J0LW15_THEBO|nr:hypothetical protein A0O31_02359 [Thermus brockianus]